MAIADGALIKKANAAEVYLIENQRRRWIPDAATLLSQWTWASVLTLSNTDVDALPMGEPLASIIVNGGLIEAAGSPAIYVIENSVRRWIPNMATFFDNDFAAGAIQRFPLAAVEAIPLGNSLPPSGRMPLDLESDLNAGHFMYTHGAFSIRTRKLRATTRTFTVTNLGGFTGGVKVIFADAEGIAVGQNPLIRYGVDGRWVGQSDRTEFWEQDVDAAIADRTATVTLFHVWAPNDNSLEGVISRAVNASRPVLDVIQEVKGITKTTGPVGAQQ